MASDSNGAGWLAKGCGLGCLGCGFLVLVGIFATFTIAPNVVDSTRSVIGRESVVTDWQGPSEDSITDPESAATLLPSTVDGLERGEIEAGTGPVFLGLDRDTLWHTTYSDADRTVQVWVMAAAEDQAKRAFDDASFSLDGDSVSARSSLDTGRVLSFTWGSPRQAAALWAPDGWLFVTHAERSKDAAGFAEALLASTDQATSGPASEPID